jgi:acetylornithine deacetylase/succinyl-diaminopimelate desuccinylase-like protein
MPCIGEFVAISAIFDARFSNCQFNRRGIHCSAMTTQHSTPHSDPGLSALAAWFDAGHFREVLARRVEHATPSEEGVAGLDRYLTEHMAPALEAMGFTCEVLANPLPGQPPFLIAERVESPDLPTLLSYGHGDVVRGQDAQWREGLGPWQLREEGDRWYGRGTADNKGQHSINLAALAHAIAAREGRLGYNVKLLLEMGEEVGSPGLRELCTQQAERLRADVFIASDGPRLHAEQPTLFLGSRGIANFSLSLRSRERAYHSGNWGGVLTNPAVVVAHAITSLIGPRGAIRVDALQPPPIDDAVRAALRKVAIGEGADDPACDPTWGASALSDAERLHAWNTLEVLAMGSGAPDRPVGAIPPAAVAHCQMRFVPGTPWEQLEPILRAHLDAHGFEDVQVKVTAATPATRLPLDNPWVDWTLAQMAHSTGKTPTLLPNLAGSLPNDAFSDILGLPTLWIPHSYPACAQHAPNEHLLAPVAREGLLMMAQLFLALGESAPWNTANAPRATLA